MTLALCFHHVSPQGGGHASTQEQFHRHLSALRERGFCFVDYDTFAKARAGGRRLPHRSVLVTTDDGYVDNFHWAYPVLRDLGVPAVFFVITGFVGEGPVRSAPEDPDGIGALADETRPDRFMRWSELRALHDSGLVSIQSHTNGHERREGPEDSPMLASLAADLARSCDAIQAEIGLRPTALAWPWGRSSARSRRIAEGLGLGLQFSVTPGRIGGWSSSRLMSRLCVDERSTDWLLARAAYLSSPMVGDAYSIARIGWNLGRGAMRRQMPAQTA
jgi:peptidoglycan/xylan/chitin deacetylase (PgdA/CDA1 family)